MNRRFIILVGVLVVAAFLLLQAFPLSVFSKPRVLIASQWPQAGERYSFTQQPSSPVHVLDPADARTPNINTVTPAAWDVILKWDGGPLGPGRLDTSVSVQLVCGGIGVAGTNRYVYITLYAGRETRLEGDFHYVNRDLVRGEWCSFVVRVSMVRERVVLRGTSDFTGLPFYQLWGCVGGTPGRYGGGCLSLGGGGGGSGARHI